MQLAKHSDVGLGPEEAFEGELFEDAQNGVPSAGFYMYRRACFLTP